ncbi:DNA-3-methyladenine glycosylase [Aneurinibacillus uraniidurans]|uniref:DNA-3-methyladenine glycosylase n=1 Tax=Aneurinibacillus uraniidurans TaxID=2966586 RepID=UPI00234BD801|nr:DNA-3-methyladenine glycosylase [Aneurinibacillus sp. B1]WCN37971.1 DNA-3-methyladenine glycosylase [Aneurinibacillus sp. B1]
MKLDRDFYNRDAVTVARELLGKRVVHQESGICRAGIIVETEAYMGVDDKGAHSYGGRRTPRNEVMYGPPGYSYVYIIYGMYNCLNAVVNEAGTPQGVLIRALEPMEGIDAMAEARFGRTGPLTRREMYNLTNGPGKLCVALGLTRAHNGLDLLGDELFITEPLVPLAPFEVNTGPRINIDYAEEAVHYPWRFTIKDNPYLSRK